MKGIACFSGKYINIETGEELEMKEIEVEGIGLITYVDCEREVNCQSCSGTGLVGELPCDDCSGSGAYTEAQTPIMVQSDSEEAKSLNLPKGWNDDIGGEE
jgi:DnaJ-class molecular chaperone